MIDHFGINCADLQKTASFYDKVLATLGHRRLLDFEVAGPNREVHVAFTAPDADGVRAFFQAAVDQGAEVLHEPRLWPEYHEHYYGAFVRDPEGNNLEAVCHRGDS